MIWSQVPTYRFIEFINSSISSSRTNVAIGMPIVRNKVISSFHEFISVTNSVYEIVEGVLFLFIFCFCFFQRNDISGLQLDRFRYRTVYTEGPQSVHSFQADRYSESTTLEAQGTTV